MKNGYFQVVCGNDGTVLKIFSPSDGGKPVNVKEVVNYLNRNDIFFDVSILNKGLKEALD